MIVHVCLGNHQSPEVGEDRIYDGCHAKSLDPVQLSLSKMPAAYIFEQHGFGLSSCDIWGSSLTYGIVAKEQRHDKPRLC
jgi:hypothetical protein